MNEPFESSQDTTKLREQIIGLGSRSLRKNYYPQLQQQIAELQKAKGALLVTVGDLEAARLGIEESERKFRTLFEKIIDGVVVVDMETHKFRMANHAFCQMLGYLEAELLQLTVSDITPPEELPGIMEDFAKMKQGEAIKTRDIVVKRKDGSLFDVGLNASPLDFDNQHSLLAVFRDITERKKAEEELRASETKFRIFADNTYDWEFWQSPEGHFLYASPSCYRITGHAAKEFEADPELLYRIIHPADQSSFLRHRNEVSRTKVSGEVEFRVKRPDGTERWIAHVCQPLFSKEGHYLGLRGSNRDITERKQVEEALRESQEQLRLLVAQAPITVAMFDRDMNYIATSRRWIAEYGRGHDDLTGLNHYDIKYDMPEYWRDVHRKALAGEAQECEEDRWVLADGTVNWLRWAVHPWRDAHQQIGGLIISTEDITKRKQAEAALKESEYRYAMAQRAANIGSWDWTIPTGEVHWSDCIEPMFGYAPGGFAGTYEAFLQSIHPEDRQRVSDAVDAALQKNGNYVIEHRIVWPDGTVRWVSETGDVHRDEQGTPVRMFGIVKDITERKRAAKEGLQLTRLIENSQDFIGLTELNGPMVFLNTAGRKLVGLESDVTLPPNLEFLMPEDWPFATETLMPTVIREGRWVGEFNFRHFVTHEPIAMFVDAFRIDDPDTGHPWCMATVSRDIRELKRTESERERLLQETRAAKEMAEAASQAKDQFIAVLSHELRTPLMPVLATVSAMESQGNLPSELKADIEVIRRSVEMEARLIDDLLDVTRISKGKVELQQEALDIHACLEAALKICQEEIEAKQLNVSMNLQADKHHVWADPTRLQQVFWNLIRNAVKFTPENGRIELRSANTDGELCIEISDTGIGIAPEVLPRIFNIFEQGQQKRTRQFGGLGLGLSIAKTLMELHGGTLSAFSEGKDKGATFTLKIPTIAAVEPSPTPATPFPMPSEQPRKILLVDDHADTLQTMARLLRRWGYTVVTATCVQGALEQASKEPFDLLISDLGLPDGSGSDIMREMQNRFGTHGIALSGYGTEEDIRESRIAGFEDHLVKPVSFDVLRATIQRVVNQVAASI